MGSGGVSHAALVGAADCDDVIFLRRFGRLIHSWFCLNVIWEETEWRRGRGQKVVSLRYHVTALSSGRHERGGLFCPLLVKTWSCRATEQMVLFTIETDSKVVVVFVLFFKLFSWRHPAFVLILFLSLTLSFTWIFSLVCVSVVFPLYLLLYLHAVFLTRSLWKRDFNLSLVK